MKKLVLAFVAVAAISFASCGNTQKPAQNADTANVDTPQVETQDTDSISKAAQDAPVKGDSTNAQK